MRSKKRIISVLGILAALLLVCAILACAFGPVSVSVSSIVKMSLNKLHLASFEPTWPGSHETIIFDIRFPRVIAGIFVGAALASAGVIFQGLLRNPMADPYIIGTSAGAALGATLAMMIPVSFAFLSLGIVPVAAFCGALVTVILVYNLARVGGKTPVVSMLLAGFVTSSMLAGIMTLLISINSGLQEKLTSVFRFLMGGFSIIYWNQLLVVIPLVLIDIFLAQLLARQINAFSLGEEGAAHLGINVERSKLIFLALGALLTATAVSISGLIGFVGLITPHAMRLILGPDHRLLLPASALGGGIFLTVADLVARTMVAPSEVPVGAITAVIGAPFFIYLLRRSKREYTF